MTSQDFHMDEIDHAILQQLTENARVSFRELAKVVGLSPAATTSRVHALESSGVITGYKAQIAAHAFGANTRALVRLTSSHNTTTSVNSAEKFGRTHPAVRTIFRVLGDCDVIFLVEARSLQELDSLVSDLGRYGVTNTTMVVEAEQIAPQWP